MKVKSKTDIARLIGDPPKDPLLALADAVRQSSDTTSKSLETVHSAIKEMSNFIGEKTPVNITVPEREAPTVWRFKFVRDRNGFLTEIVAKAD